MVTLEYKVTGMSCEHCASAVESELSAIPGVTSVSADLSQGGTSLVTVTSQWPLPEESVRAALATAGEYQLANG